MVLGALLASTTDLGRFCFFRAFYAKASLSFECPYSSMLWDSAVAGFVTSAPSLPSRALEYFGGGAKLLQLVPFR